MSGDRLLESDAPLRAMGANSGSSSQLDLAFAADSTGRTWLATQRAAYPFHVGRCLSIAGDPPGMSTVYVQSCSGGIFERDVLRWRIAAEPGVRANLSTAAATVVHSMEQGEARHDVLLTAAAGSYVEYLPDPLILFPRARLRNRVCIRLDGDATVLAWDGLLAHDPKAGASATPAVFDRMHSELCVETREGALLARDRYALSGALLVEPYRCQGTLFVLRRAEPAPSLLEALRESLAPIEGVYAGASALPNRCGVLVRVLACDGAALRNALHAAWSAARLALLGVSAAARRK